MKNKRIVAAVAAACMAALAIAQTSTVSPYTRFGLGRLSDPSMGVSRSMGGVAYGLRNSGITNPYNPASYSDADSTTFVFDFGVSIGINTLEENGSKETHPVGGFEYAAIKFPIMKNMGASVGVLPYATTGYQYGKSTGEVSGNEVYSGTGSLSQVYVGLAYQFFNCISLGANVSYLFGNSTNSSSIIFSDANTSTTMSLNSLRTNSIKYDLGLQFSHKIGKNDRLVIGMTYTPQTAMNSYFHNSISVGGEEQWGDTTKVNFDIPQTFGLGLSYQIKDRWLIAADAQYQQWAATQYFNETNKLNNRLRLSAGVEFQPDKFNRNIFLRTKYRLGGHYSNSYFNVEGSKIAEYGIGVGAGIPFSVARGINSVANISFDYVRNQPMKASLMSDNYFRFTINIAFNEYMFFKRKLD